ncbi:MAG: transposase [Chloroflexota bacterium]
MDSSYDVLDLGHAVHDPAGPLGADVLLRLPKRRRFFRKPPPYSGKGAPKRHGAVFNLRKPETFGTPDHSESLLDPERGKIQVDVWEGMHDQHDWRLSFPIVRIQAERLPKAGRKPEPLCLAWLGVEPLSEILDYWRIYKQRFTVEHGIRFLKNDLGWTTVRPRDPASADRWSWMLVIALWQLYLARSLVQDIRLPWEPASASRGTLPRQGSKGLRPSSFATGLPLPRGPLAWKVSRTASR